MALETKSMFYFGFEVTADLTSLDFTEDATPLLKRTATLTPGYYSPTEFYTHVAAQMTEAGTQTYTWAWNRTTRVPNVSAPADFSLDIASGGHAGTELWTLIGFDNTGLDKTGSNSYAGDFASGYVYRPQFFLLDYIPADENQEAVEATINETGSGRIEVIRFGVRKFAEFTMTMITNIGQPHGGLIDYNPTGKEDATFFLKELVKKGHIEFMPDRDDVETFQTLLLESTSKSSKGLGFKLVPDEFGAEIYTSGKLVFRLIE